ncbi:hypothetical protein K432DRAFT_380269 [Lepidopterella palustris CBS 459.81]|uniref:DUF4139 domain-containing protein n=1 Tax=Lepidopterella palustris CBS 459.81 TaxID=1314670 RepID=A0A8E2EEQ3_9PEZI|nr:hypothetical protein K432DRAFT_380269 [Lepidopterella palustris CBS 459.81]
MASDIPKQVILIKDLSTKSVVLYPTRAHVVRDINDVVLKPGANEVEIYGLTPTVDEHSIQIEGRGAATIVDMTVDLVPNRDIFEELYPEDSEESSSESEKDFEDSDDEVETVRTLSKEIKALRTETAEAIEMQNSANVRLMALDKYAKSIAAEHNNPEEVSKLLKKYEVDRLEIYGVHTSASRKIDVLNKKIARKEDERLRAGKGVRKEKKKMEKQKAKDQHRKDLRKAEKRKEAVHIKQERLRYWPKKVYKVTLQLETASVETPSSSRRGSVDSVTLAQSPLPEPGKAESSTTETTICLSLSYVTKEAGWTPRYDLKISSLHKSATIVYRTEFLNRTGETWKDAKISFSTSQTSYQGLDDVVPFMHAWRVKLAKYDHHDGGLLSLEEAQKPRSGRPTTDNFNRSEVFGLDDNFIPTSQKRFAQQQPQFQVQQPQAPGGSKKLLGQAPQAQSGFGSTSNMYSSHDSMQVAQQNVWGTTAMLESNARLDGGIEKARRSTGSGLFGSRRGGGESEKEEMVVDRYDPTIEDTEYPTAVEFEESSWEDNGLTATYDVPGVRTLVPSSMTRRHKIASLNATNINLSHICVPKLRAAAFLRAKIRNPSSSVTLLKGSAGVTLDGSFLGNMTLPRVSPGQLFDLPLGVDPSIHINYPKPSVHRSTQGIMFNKESAQVFTRSIWINNTKSAPIELLVIDQVPVSEDERLKIVITQPRGLSREGDSAKAGVSAKEGSSGSIAVTQSSSWGHAVAKLKKNGELNWGVKLEKGQGCLLKLDYEARLPPAEKIVPA